jgi:demethylmenaquinone methyltransferase / 2-methoxy-6-polyprenyl-1,4-benzoquinol methylase
MKQREYDIEMWQNVLRNLPVSYIRWFEEEKRYLVSNITKDSKVLEVGMGDGRSLNDIIETTKNITGIDHDLEAVEKTKKLFERYPNIKIIGAEADNLPFEDRTFDFVICMTTFANFGDNKLKILNEMKRVLKNDGNIIISVFSEKAFDDRMRVYKKVNCQILEINGTTVKYKSKYGNETSEQFSEKQLRDIFEKSKLNVLEIKKLDISYIVKLKK